MSNVYAESFELIDQNPDFVFVFDRAAIAQVLERLAA
jgi:hypothetical protein